MTAFQSTVNITYAFGVPGEQIQDEPFRAESLIMNSSGTPNIVGYAFTKSNQTNVASVGGTPRTATGSITASAVGNTITTATISGFVMTVTAIGAGSVLAAGQTLATGTGGAVAPGTVIVSQLTGTAGSTGTYQVNISQTVTTGSILVSGGGLTVTVNASAVLQPGDLLSGGTLAAGTTITAYGTLTGAAGSTGTAAISTSTASTSGTVTVAAQGPGIVFAGILVNPKVYASIGTTAGTLTPTLTLPDNAQGEFCTMGTVVVQMAGPANVGDLVQFATATGALSAVAPGSSATGGNVLIPNCVVWRFPTVANGLCAIRLTN